MSGGRAESEGRVLLGSSAWLWSRDQSLGGADSMKRLVASTPLTSHSHKDCSQCKAAEELQVLGSTAQTLNIEWFLC